jgi:glycosyltransferase involved in cell wall biosynthesis
MVPRFVTALPVFNEAHHVDGVLDEVLKYCDDVVVIDDGSTDGTADLLAKRADIQTVVHPVNRGYGAALVSAFQYAIDHHYDVLVTIDCDGQHEPKRIPEFVDEMCRQGADLVSGSRYLEAFDGDSVPPEQRRAINARITEQLNGLLKLKLTDAFCGFKAYRVDALRDLTIEEAGYGMPLEFWVQAVCQGLKVVELPVPLIYLDEKRSFGGALDDGEQRYDYYQQVLTRALRQLPNECYEAFVGEAAE